MTIKFSDITGGGIPYGNNAGRPANPGIGKLYSNGEAQRLELYTATGWNNIVQEVPGVSGITGQYLESNSTNTIGIVGTNFVSGALAYAIGTNGVEVPANSTTFNSIVSLSATFSGLSSANEPYDIKVVNPSNLFGILPDALFVNNILSWQTAAGPLGIFGDNINISVSATALDDSTITYSLASGSSLPGTITLNSSTGLLSGNTPDVASNTTYSFTINASDGQNPAVPRTFSFTVNASPIWSTASGSLGTFGQGESVNVQLSAPDVSDSVTFALASGSSLPSGLSISSSGLISGTTPNTVTDTTYSFTVNALDGVNTTPRQFSISYINLDGSTSQKAFSSPTQAALSGASAGTYYFKGGSMSSSRQLYYSGSSFEDGSPFVRVFSSPFASNATVNELDFNIPFNKFFIRRNDGAYKALVRFSSNQVYNLTTSTGITGISGTNNIGQTVATRVILGFAGGHGVYNSNQAACNWGDSTGSVGAGFDGQCGSFPNALRWGTGTSSAQYSNMSGTFEHWVSW